MGLGPVRLLVVDDHPIVRRGVSALLAKVDGIEVVGEAGDGAEAIDMAKALNPNVILMDLVMPHVDGIEAIRQITRAQPAARILVLTSFAGDDKVFPAIKAGALGYLLKDSRPRELVRAIHQVHRGEPSLPADIARKVLLELSRPSDRPPTPDPLTSREIEVLQAVARGRTNRQIAKELIVTEATVRSHVSNILGKLHLANRVQATLYALKEGLASLENGYGTEDEKLDEA